jgi:hypothetical protein
MAEFDIEKFLNTPIDAFDFQFMISDVKDFLEFSESNIDWQHQRELQAISHRKDFDDYPHGYREHLEENTAHRFKVSLPLRVRYGALLAFTTSVEWAVGYLNRSASVPVPDSRDGTNHTIKVIREFATRAAIDPGGVVEDYEALVQIRNCIVHSAGIVATSRFKDDLPKAVARISGISLANWNFFGEQVCIERGALEPYIDKTSNLVISLHTAMREKGFLK